MSLVAADLAGADFSGTDLRSSDLREADLTGAKFVGALLGGVNFAGANLKDADLTKANLFFTNFTDADLTGVIETGAYSCNVTRPNGGLDEGACPSSAGGVADHPGRQASDRTAGHRVLRARAPGPLPERCRGSGDRGRLRHPERDEPRVLDRRHSHRRRRPSRVAPSGCRSSATASLTPPPCRRSARSTRPRRCRSPPGSTSPHRRRRAAS